MPDTFVVKADVTVQIEVEIPADDAAKAEEILREHIIADMNLHTVDDAVFVDESITEVDVEDIHLAD